MKVLAVSSIGGHWVQLLRLMPAYDGDELEFVSTNKGLASTVPAHKFHYVPDGSRSSKISLLKCFFKIIKIVYSVKPDVVITTGAAPGLMAIIAGRLLGVTTIWVDSIANSETISMSGKIALKFANVVYTQWQHLEGNGIIYKGNVLG